MSADDIIKIIDAIPQYIRFVYPGYLVLYLYAFFRSYKLKDSKGVIIKSIAISYIITILADIFVEYTQIIAYNFCLILWSIFIAYISYIVVEYEIQDILDILNIKTSTKLNEISSLYKNEEYAYIRVYLKDKPIAYEGYLIEYEAEHTEDKRFLILNEYTQLYINENNEYIERAINNKEYYRKSKEKVLLYFENIDRIEKCSHKRIEKSKESH